ncbi:hypothetical protein Celgi_0926 [Cellulomonas gilvus ATCC 13127]|uniref:DUF4190 domain-containing protein n=1 Tax=Cellulomonas gilvus (strain ATCC 13127 / NRRL B-14078) TaxID=593907 RepID=F8A026_CELGA|nr:hypothetical protein Celgi_0926 [Cellulomonas gilvus ATCC 13127]
MGQNAGVSNPYAPPDEQAPRRPEDRGDARGPHGAPPAPPAHGPAGPQWGMPPGQQPTAPPPPHPEPPDPELVARAARLGRVFAALLLAGVITGTFPVPWQAASLVFGVLALVVGGRALLVALRSRQRGLLTGMLAAGLGITAMWVVVALGMTLMWPAQLDRQRCLAGALTITAERTCEAQFEQDLTDWRERLGR